MARDICPSCHSTTALGEQKCFKCGYRVAYSLTTFRNRLLTFDNSSELELPEGIIYNPNQFHYDALLWLHQAHIFKETIVKQHIGYCPNEHKVFIPYLKQDELAFYELRKLRDEDYGPKYKFAGERQLATYNDFDSKTVVIVEDHLSAIRLREVSNVISLGGTCISQDEIKYVLNYYTNVIFWLDPDGPGQVAYRKMVDRFSRYSNTMCRRNLFLGINPTPADLKKIDHKIWTNDPKKYSRQGLIDALRSTEDGILDNTQR